MKEVKSYNKPHTFARDLALYELGGLTGMSVIDAQGYGRNREKLPPKKAGVG